MMVKPAPLLFTLITAGAIFSCGDTGSDKYKNWTAYRGDDGITAYSGLKHINTQNVNNLQVAWSFRTHDNVGNSSIKCNPLIINGVL